MDALSQQTRVLDRLLEQLVDCLTPAVARRITEMRVDPRVQARIDELASKASQGQLTEGEWREYHAYVEAFDLIGVLQEKACALCQCS